jgi:hypothetical protein
MEPSGTSAGKHLPSQRRDRPGLAPGSLTVLSCGGRAYHRIVASPPSFAIDLDAALGDTRQLWSDWLTSAARVLPLDIAQLPADRGAAAAALDAEGGNWRVLLERFAEERAPIYLRPQAETSAALRRLGASGARLGVFTDAPLELAQIALDQLGASRRVSHVEAGAGALERLLAELGTGATVVQARDELVTAGH